MSSIDAQYTCDYGHCSDVKEKCKTMMHVFDDLEFLMDFLSDPAQPIEFKNTIKKMIAAYDKSPIYTLSSAHIITNSEMFSTWAIEEWVCAFVDYENMLDACRTIANENNRKYIKEIECPSTNQYISFNDLTNDPIMEPTHYILSSSILFSFI